MPCHYKKDVAANRDALFGGGGGGGGGSSSRRAPAPRAAATTASSSSRPRSAAAAAAAPSLTPSPFSGSGHSSSSTTAAAAADPTITPGPSTIFTSSARASRNVPVNVLSGQAKIAKMAEAEDYRLKAKKAMTRGVFSKPDPISAANFYKRAADCYKQCGENRLERLHRIAGGDCQLGQDAYATAAAEYTRAAELAEESDEALPRKRQECRKLHLDAAGAWNQMGERGRAAESTMKAAFGLVMGDEAGKAMDGQALQAVEEAVESFVPDPLNAKRHYRRTGASAYQVEGGNAAASDENTMELARQNIVSDSFAHETLFKVSTELVKRRHYETALYAHGAGTATLEHEGFATVSLFRAYLSSAVLTLAMGDAVAASRDFRDVHLQRTAYLSSRECALEEDLIRAVENMDGEALEEARSREGPHRSAMANLDPVVRGLVGEIRVSGRAKKEKGEKKKVTKSAGPSSPSIATNVSTKPVASPPPKKKELSGEELIKDTDDGFSEMDDIMNQMGLNDDDEDDDDIDLT